MARNRTILEYAVLKGGIYRGGRAAEVVVTWAIAERELGHRLGADEGGHLTAAVREYADYWKQSERTAWRDVKRFREVFGEESPARLAGLLNAAVGEHAAERSQLLAGVRLAV